MKDNSVFSFMMESQCGMANFVFRGIPKRNDFWSNLFNEVMNFEDPGCSLYLYKNDTADASSKELSDKIANS